MPRTKKPVFSFFNGCKGKNASYIRVASDLLFCEAFRSLHGNSQALYLRMLSASKGRMEFIYPYSLELNPKSGEPYLSKGAFFSAVTELERAGFIVRQSNKNLRKPNEYKFSNVWVNNADCRRCGRCADRQ